MQTPSVLWLENERLDTIHTIARQIITAAEGCDSAKVPHTEIDVSEVKDFAQAISDAHGPRLVMFGTIVTIASYLRDLGNSYWANTWRETLDSPLSPHKLEDWGSRIMMLLNRPARELQLLRDEILDGNPAKYQ